MFENVALLILFQAGERDGSYKVQNPFSAEGFRMVPNESFSAASESTVLYTNEHCHESG